MTLRVYDTLSREKRPLRPVRDDRVGVYVCGMTVQGEPHVGHARAAVCGDVLHRYLGYVGYSVEYLTNFTDVDDKIIARAAEEGVGYREVAERNILRFHEMEEELNLLPASRYPKATEHIPQILRFIEALVERGHGYATAEGDVYFDVRSFPGYGELSGRTLDEAREGTRVESETNKRSAADFALWKRARAGEPAWASKWGEGRPGWHIECSAMAMEYLGDTVDVHGGGLDLVFPHHENERAQSEALTGKPFASHWAENGLVTLDGEKMAKSTGNFLTVADLLTKVPGPVVRLYLLQTHYRSPIDFSIEQVSRAKAAHARLSNFVRAVGELEEGSDGATPSDGGADELRRALASGEAAFREAMDDDLNTARALGGLFDLVRRGNQLLGGAAEHAAADTALLRETAAHLRSHLEILGISIEIEAARADEGAGRFIDLLVELRRSAREERNWATADRIRDRLAELGVVLEDGPKGTAWRWTESVD